MVIKLDFQKAFDYVSWSSHLTLLQVRGFPPLFCSWTKNTLSTRNTAILLNGIHGPWIQCKNGLRQGDPISPYLYTIFSDILQQLIRTAFQEQKILHPLRDDIAPVVLQYADDTLIIAKASSDASQHLKETLDSFALTTSLQINFHKTTFVPMNLSDDLAASIATIPWHITAHIPSDISWPTPFTHKTTPSAFQMLLDRFDDYLA
jgi:hypothetical protein